MVFRYNIIITIKLITLLNKNQYLAKDKRSASAASMAHRTINLLYILYIGELTMLNWAIQFVQHKVELSFLCSTNLYYF